MSSRTAPSKRASHKLGDANSADFLRLRFNFHRGYSSQPHRSSELAPSLARGEDYSVLRASTSAISMKHLAFNRLLVTQIPFATRSWSMQKTVFGS
jgi:hypothetical protein